MKKVVPVLIVLVLIVISGGMVVKQFMAEKYRPTEDFMNYAEAYGLAEDEYTILLNGAIHEKHGKIADGRVYLPMTVVTKEINSRFYWDKSEKVLIYSLPDAVLKFTADKTEYVEQAWDGSVERSEDYPVLKKIGKERYIDAEYVKSHTKADMGIYDDPRRIAIRTQWGEKDVVTARRETPIRYKGGIKSEVLRNAQDGETFVVLDPYDDWTQICTEDGFLGWISTEDTTPVETMALAEADFDEPEYTSIQRDHKINMLWHQVMSSDANYTIYNVLDSSPGINTISPTWFYFTGEEGEVASSATYDYVSYCHDRGIEVWALFSNEFTSGSSTDRVFDSELTDKVLSSSSKREAAIRQVINVVKEYDIDGVNIDFESISADGADDYIQFIREMSIACRYEGIVLSVDNYVPKFTQYYNRKEQGIWADYVVIMGYDETTGGSGTPGPVASQQFVREGISDTLAMVDKDKVINGIPFYTRVWCTDTSGEVSSFACGMTEALSYLTDHGVEPEYKEDAGLMYGEYVSDVNGATYQIWLQDATAVEDEMKMISESDIAGVASWKSGFESGTEIWEIISRYMN